ncbi:MAG TPA: hypothetical protein VGK87_06500 [Anaerolineae bacterium]|jgi:hypothetical protein
MNDRNSSNVGCALFAIVALIAIGIVVIAVAPWLLVVVPLVIISVIVCLVLLADVTSDDVLVNSDEPGGYDAFRIRLLNPLRRAFTKPPLLQVPRVRVTYEERQMVKQAVKLTVAIAAALKNNKAIGADGAAIQQKADEVPANMAKALWQLDRLRRVKRTVDERLQTSNANQPDIVSIDRQIVAEMQRSLDALSQVPVNMMKVELQQDSRPAERLLADLNETNQHLRDIDSSFSDIRGAQAKQ